MAKKEKKHKIGLIKGLAILLGLVTQIYNVYVLWYKVSNGEGYKIPNIILLIISSIYLLFNLFTIKSEYTPEEMAQKKNAKKFYKSTKKLIRGIVIAIAIYEIYTLPEARNLTNITMTGILAFSFMVTLVLDIMFNTFTKGVKKMASGVKEDITTAKEKVGKAKDYVLEKRQAKKQQKVEEPEEDNEEGFFQNLKKKLMSKDEIE